MLVSKSLNAAYLSKQTSRFISATKSVLNLVAMMSSPAQATMLDKLLANFFYLSLLSGPFLAFPHILFTAMSGASALPIGVGNFFTKISESGDCTLPQ